MAISIDQSQYSVNVDLESFQREVIEASAVRPVLVDFWADWCAPCHALAPHLGRVVADLDGRIGLAKIEVDEGENMKLAGQYKLRGFPTVILFYRGEELARFSGARSRHEILDWLRIHLPDDLAGLAVS
ncbi:thioredoxin family protein [Thiocapsa rosea]|uniref:Thioredoxin n=1 Tax=Thiocapsa rosea TaxID=69360 RepID=A0A495V6M7_9GAMM|nr:thioredoxin family protein [Thiocapsa rosea]RKT43997.1 putative thioredoxin [Thiocapsa rosea]